MKTIKYGFELAMEGVELEEAIARVRAALQSEGFGILTEIDVRKTLKEKLNQDFRRYHILGACNPQLAHRALMAEPQIGLLLPCNVVVQETADKGVLISIADPGTMQSLVENPDLDPVVEEAFDRLDRVYKTLKRKAGSDVT